MLTLLCYISMILTINNENIDINYFIKDLPRYEYDEIIIIKTREYNAVIKNEYERIRFKNGEKANKDSILISPIAEEERLRIVCTTSEYGRLILVCLDDLDMWIEEQLGAGNFIPLSKYDGRVYKWTSVTKGKKKSDVFWCVRTQDNVIIISENEETINDILKNRKNSHGILDDMRYGRPFEENSNHRLDDEIVSIIDFRPDMKNEMLDNDNLLKEYSARIGYKGTVDEFKIFLSGCKGYSVVKPLSVTKTTDRKGIAGYSNSEDYVILYGNIGEDVDAERDRDGKSMLFAGYSDTDITLLIKTIGNKAAINLGGQSLQKK